MDFFTKDFFASFFAVSAVIVFIIMIKRILKNHISEKWQYRIYYLVFLLLTLPFVPLKYINFIDFSPNNENILKTISQNTNVANFENTINSGDFAVSVKSHFDFFKIFFVIWLIGAIILTVVMVIGFVAMRQKRKNISMVDCKIKNILYECKNISGIKKNIDIAFSDVKSPVIFGMLKPIILVPYNCVEKMSDSEIKYIILHELSHYKNKDILMNYLMCIFQILYWFNPLVWIIFKQMKIEREIVCDSSVLNMLDEDNYTDYGMTIIRFVETVPQKRIFALSADMGGSKKHIKMRIEKIASFTKETLWSKLKGIAIFTMVFAVILSQASVISIAGGYNYFNDKKDNINIINLDKYFEGYNGSFVLYDMNNDEYTVYNEEKSRERVSPNSTYKIYSALSALENGVITEENSLMNWDGVLRYYDEWNRDLDLYGAMKYSANWYFDKINSINGIENVQNDLIKIGYGNCDFSGGNDCWLESSLKISPLEQVDILKDFYTNNFGFSQSNIDTVKNSIKILSENDTVLYGKTGTGRIDDKDINGWFVGFVEKGDNVYIFATNIEADENATGSVSMEKTIDILNNEIY
ncbi:MAG TPA: BlaR1 family beta-lactam sensor/signal transducer [Candidatus Fimicola cottocaccae]|nr:BlaR1 family beta-lactam sensor/signal transducer [Candidatus Fimicola cottocaccae]